MFNRTMIATAAAVSLTLAVTGAFAQDKPMRVRGDLTAFDGQTLSIKTRDGKDIKVKLADNARIAGIVKISIADIKQGNYIGVSAMPQPDGSQRALHVHVFPEPLRGVAEGHAPWDVQPGSTMTNATVAETVTGTDGQNIMVKYKDGEKKIIVPKDAPLVTYVPGDKADLKPGAKIFIVAAKPEPDGTFSAASVSYGKDGLTPPM